MNLLGLLLCGITLASANLQNASPEITPIPGGLSGAAHTGHYWDCCVQACSYPNDLLVVTHGVSYCLADGETKITNYTGTSECNDPAGNTFACNDNQPWIVNSTLAYGFTAASFVEGLETGNCCQCFLLSFQGRLYGKHYLVQITNTDSDLTNNHFDFQIPGGGVGNINGCQKQWNAGPNGWGTNKWMGVQSEAECSKLPQVLQEGCKFRWTFLEGVEKPDVTYQQVICPNELTTKTGCVNVKDPKN